MKNTTRPRLSRLCVAVDTRLGRLHAGVSLAQPQPHRQLQKSPKRSPSPARAFSAKPGFATAVPVTAVTLEDLESFKPGATIADQLDQLPQFFQTQSAQRGGGALFGGAGRSVLNLRAMGPQRTLVLLDGARLAPADRDGSVHVDNIPTALLSQVEVVTGGASAAYGADALAGVTNFRMNRNYRRPGPSRERRRAPSDGMGDKSDLSVAFGTTFGERWHFIGSAREPEDRPDRLRSARARRLVPPLRHRRESGVDGAATDASQPQRLVLPTCIRRMHTPTGRSALRAMRRRTVPFTLAQTFTTLHGLNFNYAARASAVRARQRHRRRDVEPIGRPRGRHRATARSTAARTAPRSSAQRLRRLHVRRQRHDAVTS